MTWKHMTCHINKYDPGHTSLKQQQEKNTQTTFVSPSKSGTSKQKKASAINDSQIMNSDNFAIKHEKDQISIKLF